MPLLWNNKRRQKMVKAYHLCTVIMCGYYLLTTTTSVRKERRWWVKLWRARRDERGTLGLLQRELRYEDPDEYKIFLRMDEVAFNLLLRKVQHVITKRDTVMRSSIAAEDRLAVTLGYLATGESYRSLSQSTRISSSSLSNIIPEVCDAIYSVLKDEFLKMPSTPEEWRQVSEDFYVSWNFPNTIGALDGKHVAFHAPTSAGSTFFNYKDFNSIVLLALVDASYGFLYIDVGVNGRVSDGGVFESSDLGFGLKHDLLNLPENRPLPGMQNCVPHVIVADAAFPLNKNLMKPFPQRNLSYEKRIFNYRLSRARRIVENTFGILANRFRIFRTTIDLPYDKVVKVTLAACVLHYFLKKQCRSYRQYDKEEFNTTFGNAVGCQYTGNRCKKEAASIRNEFLNYFNTVGAVPWQDTSIQRGGG